MDPDTFLNCEKCDARRSDVRERGNGVTCARCGWNTETEPVVVIPDQPEDGPTAEDERGWDAREEFAHADPSESCDGSHVGDPCGFDCPKFDGWRA